MRTTDEVKQKTDIVEVVSQYTGLSKAGRLLKGLCPFHSEKHASFFVYPEQQTWHCFGACATGGDVFSFLMRKEGLDFGEALRLLAERAGVSLPERPEPRANRDKEARLYQANAAAASYFNNLLLNSAAAQKARDYVSRRQLSLKSVADFQLGYSPGGWQALTQHLTKEGYSEAELIEAGLIIKADDGRVHDRFHDMLMFPISDPRGRVTGFGARVLDDSQPKYVNSPQTEIFDKSALPYGLNLAATSIRQQDSAVIVEGYTDAITAHQAGFKNVVASMGTSVTERQIGALKRLSKNIVFALDADTAGSEATLRGVAFENILGAEIKVIILPKGKDPDDVIRQDPKSWPKLLDSARPIIDYTFDRAASELDLDTAQGKSILSSQLLPTIAEMKDTVRQAHYLQKLARLVKVSEHRLEAALEQSKPAKERNRASTAVTAAPKVLLDSPLEEYCLVLLLKHPELKAQAGELSAEHFENSENREIFTALKQAEDTASLKDHLPPTLHQHLDDIMVLKSVKATGVGPEYLDFILKLSPIASVEQKFADCVLLLREKFWRAMATKISAIPAAEREAELEEQSIEIGTKLKEVFAQKQKRHRQQRR